MTSAVLDASVLVAAISPTEVHHAAARELYESLPEDRAFLVPSLFRLEVLAALVRRGESGELLDTVDVLVSGPRFHVVAVDFVLIQRSVEAARTARLRAYDAVYVALALARDASLLTLDSEVQAKIRAAWPDMALTV